jgi:acyl-CoA synthetase (NDP forming)
MSLNPESSFGKLLEKENIPNFDFPETDIRVLAAMIKYYTWIKQPQVKAPIFKVDKESVKKIVSNLKTEKRIHLTEPESYGILESYGMKSVDSRLEKNIEDAVVAAEKIGYPVVLKIVSPDIVHKIDVGGVEINLKNESDFKKAFRKISESVKSKKPEARIQGFLIQKHFTEKGVEIIAGVKAINGFGHLIMFGSGGTFVELFKDVAFRLAPLTKLDALDMIKETKGYQILKGFRGQVSYDIDAVADYLLRISQLVTDFPDLKEMDMNPIKVLEKGKGAIIMDAKMVLEDAFISTYIPEIKIEKEVTIT